MGVKGPARPTKADVARLAKVSPATVSYVLNNVAGQKISAQTQAAVRSAAETLGYRPNLAARNLAVGGSGVVLYVLPRMALSELPIEVGSRLTNALAKHGVVVSLQFETKDPASMTGAIANLNPIAVTSIFPLSAEPRAVVEAAGIRHIDVVNTHLDGFDSLNLAVGELVVDHLVSKGHTNVAFAGIDVPKQLALNGFRRAGIRAAALERGLPEIPAGSFEPSGANAATIVTEWARQGVTAVYAASDDAAFVVLHGLREAGLRCPEDLAVIGGEASPLGPVSNPPLTSVKIHAGAIVDAAVAAMMRELGYQPDEDPSSANVFELIQRQST
ncbi:LacI family DNA-binding transcriptional regulator [Nocardia sp. 348MFTsu5.1]|uniref:LacI family DNA-binding transcriptional regulator n=1 Tax=Nocardia sp. 348MFTsu5.1 TaxID=1172185 RepID=UPI00037FE3E3|nr:LacI family DNA-binding transcriptional regulator [Nocardia sp. 348MFTsu5.1]